MEKKCVVCKQLKELSEFNKNRTRKDGLQTKCRECSKVLYKKHKYRNPDYYVKRNKRRKHESRIFVYNYLKKHPCVDCGESDPIVLQFDHVKGKRQTISKMICGGQTAKSIQKEIEKCVVRCANCHIRKTAKEQKWWCPVA